MDIKMGAPGTEKILRVFLDGKEVKEVESFNLKEGWVRYWVPEVTKEEFGQKKIKENPDFEWKLVRSVGKITVLGKK